MQRHRRWRKDREFASRVNLLANNTLSLRQPHLKSKVNLQQTNTTMKVTPFVKKRSTGNANIYLFKPYRASWPEKVEKVKVKLGTDGTSFSDYFHALEGTESPELFLLWLQEFQSKVETNTRVVCADKLDILLRIVKGEAKAVINRVIDYTRGVLQPTHVDNCDFTNKLVIIRLHQLTTRAEWGTYIGSDAHRMDIITE